MVEEPIPQVLPDDTGIGHAPFVDADGGGEAIVLRLSEEGQALLEVVWDKDTAAKVALGVLEQWAELTPPEPQHDLVHLRAPSGTDVRTALGEVFGTMFETGPPDLCALVKEMAARGFKFPEYSLRAAYRAVVTLEEPK